jgi:hypothetical protein
MSWWLGGHTRVGVYDGALFAKLTYRPPSPCVTGRKAARTGG